MKPEIRIASRLFGIGIISLAHLQLLLATEIPLPVDDPISDGWATEVRQSRAADQLNEIAKMLADSSQVSAERLSDIVAEDIVARGLQSPRLERTFADDSLTISRAALNSSSSFDHLDLAELATAFKKLGFRSEANAQARFKVYRITDGEDQFETQQILTMSGATAIGNREVHAVWRCRWVNGDQQNTPIMQSISVEDHEEVINSHPEKMFNDCTTGMLGHNSCLVEQFGFGIDYWSNRLLRVGYEGMQGLAIGDANGDGLDDFYVCQISPLPNRLFIQNDDGTATDQSAELGVDWLEPSHSALFVDWDNDGDQDLFVSTITTLLLLENNGTGSYTLRSTVTAARNAYSLAAADFDQDGDLDLFACVYVAKATQRDLLTVPVPFHDAKNGGRNVLLRNEGAWRVKDVTSETGLDEESTRRSFAASWEDFDNDGDVDLYVANDYGKNNLFRNDDGRFVDIAGDAGVEDQSFGMSVAWGDYDRDGWMDLYVSNMFSAAGNRIAFQKQFRPDDKERQKFQYMARGNSLFQNARNGRFRDVSSDARIMMGLWAWGSLFADLNNDGNEDLVVMNGFLTRRDTKDL